MKSEEEIRKAIIMLEHRNETNGANLPRITSINVLKWVLEGNKEGEAWKNPQEK